MKSNTAASKASNASKTGKPETRAEAGGSSKPDGRKGSRVHRARTVPKWLKEQQDMDDVARRRCLLVLRVMSGDVPVTDAIEEVGMSRATYYKLEERALRAMLAALSPAAGASSGEDSALEQARTRVVELEGRIKELETERRRSERLVMLTRKLMRSGPLVMPGRGRPPKKATVSLPSSILTGPNSSISSATTNPAETVHSRDSIPTQDGGTE